MPANPRYQSNPRYQWSANWLDIRTTILDARSNLLRDDILANAEYARNPRRSKPYEGNIIRFPNALVGNVENIEITTSMPRDYGRLPVDYGKTWELWELRAQ